MIGSSTYNIGFFILLHVTYVGIFEKISNEVYCKLMTSLVVVL